MATIVLVPSGVTSKQILAARLANRLVAAGHRVVRVDGEPGAAGFGAIEHRYCALRAEPDRTRRRWRPVAQWRAVVRASLDVDVDSFASVLDEIGAELLLVDIEEHEFLLAARARRPEMPVAVLNSFFGLWPVRGMPPLDSARAPSDGLVGRASLAAAWWSSRIGRLRRDVRYHLAGRKVERSSVVRHLARRLGVRREMTSRPWLHPFVPRTLPILSMTAPELDLPHRPPAHVRHVGPLLDPVDRPALDEIPDTDLRAFVERAAADGAPLVLCAFGGFMAGDDGFAARVEELARASPDLRLVSTGMASGHTPANLFRAPWLPQRELLAHAAAAVVHSGTGTLHECAFAGVPVVVYPFAVNDQAGNATRVVHHGIGLVGDRRHDDASAIAALVRTALASVELRGRVDDMAARLRAEARRDRLTPVIDELLAGAVGRQFTDP